MLADKRFQVTQVADNGIGKNFPLVNPYWTTIHNQSDNQTNTPKRTITDQGACFPAGKLIVTDKGLVPIEQIKVGDRVLSKPESGSGELAYKPVVKTVVHENKPIWVLTYIKVKKSVDVRKLTNSKLKQLSMKGQMTCTEATPNHPFWVEGDGWTRLDKLQYGQIIHSKDDKLKYMVFDVSPVYATSEKNISAMISMRNILDAEKKGQEIDDVIYYGFFEYTESRLSRDLLNDGKDVPSPLNIDGYPSIEVLDEPFTTTVYNFEVADYHTYFVKDLWVHNTNCADPVTFARTLFK